MSTLGWFSPFVLAVTVSSAKRKNRFSCTGPWVCYFGGIRGETLYILGDLNVWGKDFDSNHGMHVIIPICILNFLG